MMQAVSGVLLVLGAALTLVAALGVVRMPDLFTRMQASSKASTLGVALCAVAVALQAGDVGVTSRALVIVVFLFLTAPVAAHMLARAAYFTNVKLWDGTITDELKGQYDPETETLEPEGN